MFRYITLIVSVFISYISVQGQRIRFYNSEQGLSSSLIRSMDRDKDGFIWVGSDNGLSRYDGFSFTSCYHSVADSFSLASDVINTIFTDSRNQTWIGTNVGMQMVDKASLKFKPFDLHCPSDSRGYYYVCSICEYPQCGLLFTSISGWGIMAYNIDTHEPDTAVVKWINSSIGTNFPGEIRVDSKGMLWTNSEMGAFFMIDLEAHRVIDYSQQLKDVSGVENISVSSFAEFDDGRVLIGCYNDGLYLIDRNSKKISKLYTGEEMEKPVKVLKKDSQGRMWIGLDGGGLRLFDEQTFEISMPIFQYCPVDIGNAKVHYILEDHQSNVWVGLFQKGVICIPNVTTGFEYVKLSDIPSPTSHNMSSATSIVVDKDSSLWVGSDGAGLFHIYKDRRVVRYTIDNSELLNDAISAIAFDGEGRLWTATYMGGISILGTDGKWTRLPRNETLLKVRQLVWDEKRDRMIAGSLGHGVTFIDANTYKISSPSVLGGWIVSLYIDAADDLWVGRTEGLMCFDLEKSKLINNMAVDSLNKSTVTSMSEDPMYYWYATEKGLYKISKTFNECHYFDKSAGFLNNHLCGILPDREGNFWISTGNGLARFDTKRDTVDMFTVKDGLQDNEFINYCCTRLGRYLYFGGINGITVFDPDNIKQEQTPLSPIFLSKLSVMNSDVKYDASMGEDNILDDHLSDATTITLRSWQNMFSLKFGVLEFANPNKVKYYYRIPDIEEKWHSTAQDVAWATYTNLPAGTYTLELVAKRTGSKEMVSRTLTLVILPAWYASCWAISLYVFIVIIFILLLIQTMSLHRRRQRELELINRKDSQLRFFTNLSHEIRTPLSLVVSPLSIVKSKATGEGADMLEMIHRNVNRTLRMINQLIDLRRMENVESQMLFSRTDIADFINEIISHFTQLAVMKNITLDIKMSKSMEVWIDLDNFDKVIFNLLANAFKHTHDDGVIRVEVVPDYEKKIYRIEIENSGSHIPESDLKDVFQLYFKSNDKKRSEGSGIGLYICSQIVEGHKGTISVENTDKGVLFAVVLPMGHSHLSDDELGDEYDNSVDNLNSVQSSDCKFDMQLASGEMLDTHRKVFILDDDEEWGKMLAKMLSPDFDCTVESDSEKAWQRIVSVMPDAIVSDYLMPGIDGEELCRRLRRTPETNHILFIVVSSESDEAVKQRLIEAGADNYLCKPINIPLLKTTLAHSIQMRDVLCTKYRIAAHSDFETTNVESSDSMFIERVTECISKNLENPAFCVEDLCDAVEISRAHMNRKLKKLLNTTPGNLIKSMRLKHAAYMLVYNRFNVSDVAFRLGYSSHSYFTISFRDYYGMTPTFFVYFYSKEENREALRKLIS